MKKFIKQWLFFDEMVTPKIITLFYWVLLALMVISGIVTAFTTTSFGLIGVILGIIVLRVWVELVILFFNIYAQVKRIADNLDNKSVPTSNDNSTDD